MKITFLGVGEAFDHKQANTSIVVETAQTFLLLDCGYSVFSEVWKHNLDPNHIDCIYISHVHGDHVFGLSPLVKRMTEEKRSKELTIICPNGGADLIKQIMNLGYRNSQNKTPYKLKFLEVDEKDEIIINDLQLSFANTKHSVKNLSIRIENQNKSICYSGDGNHTPNSINLFKNTDLLIHDGYHYDKHTEGHDNISEVYDFAKKIGVKQLAFTHIQRIERENILEITNKITKFDIKSFIPNKGDVLEI